MSGNMKNKPPSTRARGVGTDGLGELGCSSTSTPFMRYGASGCRGRRPNTPPSPVSQPPTAGPVSVLSELDGARPGKARAATMKCTTTVTTLNATCEKKWAGQFATSKNFTAPKAAGGALDVVLSHAAATPPVKHYCWLCQR
jgi:hypothetical protein